MGLLEAVGHGTRSVRGKLYGLVREGTRWERRGNMNQTLRWCLKKTSYNARHVWSWRPGYEAQLSTQWCGLLAGRFGASYLTSLSSIFSYPSKEIIVPLTSGLYCLWNNWHIVGTQKKRGHGAYNTGPHEGSGAPLTLETNPTTLPVQKLRGSNLALVSEKDPRFLMVPKEGANFGLESWRL